MPDQSYRKVDIDAFDEDQYVEEEEQLASGSAATVDVKAIQTEVRSLIQKGSHAAAVTKALASPPRSKDTETLKADYLQMVMDALTAVKASDIASITKDFSVDQIDTLMKYIYKGMSKPETYNSAILLAWHEKAYEIGGVGSIVRVMVDRNVA